MRNIGNMGKAPSYGRIDIKLIIMMFEKTLSIKNILFFKTGNMPHALKG